MAGRDEGVLGGPRESDIGKRGGTDRINGGPVGIYDTDGAVVAWVFKLEEHSVERKSWATH